MNLTRRRGAIAFFITLGVSLTVLAVVLNITWIHNNSRQLALDLVGIVLFSILIAGVALNTIFLVREIRRNERQDSFLNAVTHELKTPIASVRLYLDTLQRRSVDEEQRQKFYAIMHADTDRLLATVESVLKAGELGQRDKSAQRSAIELHPLVAECVRVVRDRHHLSADAIVLEDVPGNVRLYVRGINEDLRTAVLNILDNAVKYSPDGVHVRCRIGIERYTWVSLSITDTGLGLPDRELKRIFKRFYRASNDQVKIKGTGLGLFLVRTIARQHGGDVRAFSDGLGAGTTFQLRLPLAHGAELSGGRIA
jgi:signal transduction histidine kinase